MFAYECILFFFLVFFFFFQAEDGIRDKLVTGVQTCALPISLRDQKNRDALLPFGRGTAPIGRAPLVIAVLLQKGARDFDVGRTVQNMMVEIGRASCRERV